MSFLASLSRAFCTSASMRFRNSSSLLLSMSTVLVSRSNDCWVVSAWGRPFGWARASPPSSFFLPKSRPQNPMIQFTHCTEWGVGKGSVHPQHGCVRTQTLSLPSLYQTHIHIHICVHMCADPIHIHSRHRTQPFLTGHSPKGKHTENSSQGRGSTSRSTRTYTGVPMQVNTSNTSISIHRQTDTDA